MPPKLHGLLLEASHADEKNLAIRRAEHEFARGSSLAFTHNTLVRTRVGRVQRPEQGASTQEAVLVAQEPIAQALLRRWVRALAAWLVLASV